MIMNRHKEIVVTDFEKRTITLKCTCGWQHQLGLVAGTDATYADANAWASHFDLPRNDI